NGRPVDQVSLTKMERAMTLGAMPPTDFCIMHWGAAISDKEKKRVAHWAYDHRIKHYYNGLACEQHQNEPIQPIPDSIEINYRKAALGNLLYHDTRLSIDNTLSCADCHALNTAGVDNQDFSDGVNGHIGTANAPTVFNSVFNFVQFWDGRALTLAEQAVAPPINPIEMGSTDWNMIVNKLKKDKALATMFTEVYPEGFSESTITDAIGEFEKSLITPNSHFDRYLKGDQNAISQFELEGYQLFKDNECVSCHVGVNVGGLSYEKLGLTRNYFTDRGTKIMEDDLGRFKQTKHERDRHRFKVPGLRNVVLTYPYFHDGKMITLEDAIDHMAKYQINKDLSKEEISKIKAFLNTLTGEYNGKLLENDSLKKQ
ncbi:MAG: cytochrome-c peroxidase, partial [Bacteroidales bacterium]